MKNCSGDLHLLVHTYLIEEIFKVVTKKNQVTEVKQQCLDMLQSWAEAFKEYHQLPNFGATVKKLQNAGYTFRKLSGTSPVFTPAVQ
eukprot:CAMPEP_0175168072 /NCGR_PEP_ID=MMETSP0087-20121206/28739_1 /TAXON_ID=136419 /ORGANISM="Unknown Unknown, Strain D1" /LENGTH=86 /DNA_ID=CAMNT_0016458121 /DNA_START=240 /DNA_END=497 /DNA_ORIENTATION=+